MPRLWTCPSLQALNPQQLIPTSLATAPSCPDSLFSGAEALAGTSGAQWTSPVGAERKQYLQLVWRQLSCGKTRLRRKVMAVGFLFSVAKSGNRQREVWNGSAISACAEKPPAPTSASISKTIQNGSDINDIIFLDGVGPETDMPPSARSRSGMNGCAGSIPLLCSSASMRSSRGGQAMLGWPCPARPGFLHFGLISLLIVVVEKPRLFCCRGLVYTIQLAATRERGRQWNF